MMDLSEIAKRVADSKFCYAKEGGQGFVDKSQCVCSKENPCQAVLDKQRFREAFEGIAYEDLPKYRNKIVQKIKTEFKDSQWWKDNVKE